MDIRMYGRETHVVFDKGETPEEQLRVLKALGYMCAENTKISVEEDGSLQTTVAPDTTQASVRIFLEAALEQTMPVFSL